METTIAPLASLDDIQALIAKPLSIQFKVGEIVCEIQARRLKPYEDELLALQTNEIVPPITKGKTEQDDRIDYLNPAYLNKKTKGEREIRAQGLFWAIPAFQDKLRVSNEEAVKGMYRPEQRGAITKFVQELLDDEVLNYLWSQVRTNAISVPAHVNFTSPAG